MACFMNSAVPLITLILSVACSDVTISVTPSEQPLIWHTEIKIECSWPPNGMAGDILADYKSVWLHPDYSEIVNADDVTQRVYIKEEFADGKISLYIKDITRADEHEFMCTAQRLAGSDPLYITVLEPPSRSVIGLAAVFYVNAVTITFDPVDDATVYTVGIQTNQTGDWTETETSELTHTFTGLEPATYYTVRVLPGNAAGYRPGLEYMDVANFTMENREEEDREDCSEADWYDIMQVLRDLGTSGIEYIIMVIKTSFGQ